MDYWTEPQLDSIHKMVNPRSIAVVGATERMQYGGRFLSSVLRARDRVRVYPVNPRYEELMGVPCYPSVGDLPESPDLVGIIVPYHRVIAVLRECAEKGAGSAIVISAGFAERGTEERRVLQEELGVLARETGVRISGPNCLGIANVRDNIWACSTSSVTDVDMIGGNVALVCQSGASAFGPFLSRAVARRIGYSYIVSTGNEADLETTDFVRYLLDDDDTRVIAMFIEGFKDPRKFLEVAKMAAEKGTPIVAIKIGRSEPGTVAARSHTAAITGADEVYEAAFRQYGVIRVHDWDKLLEVSQLLADGRAPKRHGVALVSHSGGVCSLTADVFGQAELELPGLTDHARDGINDILQGFGWAANPADITGHANRDTVAPIMEYMINEPEVGALVVASSASEAQAQHIVDLRAGHDELVAFLYTGNELGESTGLETLRNAHIPVFHSPENLAYALRQLHDYHSWRKGRMRSGFARARPASPDVLATAEELLSSHRGALGEHEAKKLLDLWGIQTTLERRASTVEEASVAAREIGYPVVLKVESPDILHKTEAGALRLDIRDAEMLRLAYDEILRNAREYAPSADLRGVLVQETVRGGVEVIVGVTQDPQLGPVLLYGLGGVLVELMSDVAHRVCPITRWDAQEMVDEVKGSRLLKGFRGRRWGDISALLDTLMKLSDLAVNLRDRVQEIDINPLAVLPEGEGVKAVDALVTISNSSGRTTE